ncbi:VOC family protein [Corynebacterium guangdongense]|uniref:3-demethylubiquinone-9 3-methyltransferase (Glyoxalase superfamily) n=1 Tax=Corynebacterium guangdongense TaxID=1783348 RepID=A0ABU1ZYW5_9CORY|nr:VOC family protein [Corynebacterium guangdongense]MDR7329578.1 putative 3-demethylubiquinone-9 3-methyltransferase (glyoxalase superfamily) [Corynebacterium guangdongense]WJZ18143.1 3-demethylubiquinone-9 3-methyltransferase [Corynebacterium guangdongense]
MQTVTPCIWCNGTADEAAEFYAGVFPDSSIIQTDRYPTEGLLDFQQPLAGQTLTQLLDLNGYRMMLINAGDEFAPNPSISFFINVDPGVFDNPRRLIDELWAKLTDGGHVLMPLGDYPHSEYYGWVADRFGVSWQLMLTDPAGEPRPFIVPDLMFCGPNQNRATEAVDTYVGLFRDARLGTRVHYPAPQGPVTTESVIFSEFTVQGEWLAAMDSGVEQNFTFTEGVSLMVEVPGQEEIDRLWAVLAHEEQPCGWCRDEFGVSWQIVPDNLGELLRRPGAFETFMGMTRIVIGDFPPAA